MAEQYLGSCVSIDCGQVLGYFQGQVYKVDTSNQTISLKDVWKNGVKSTIHDITLCAKDIVNLSIISPAKNEKPKKNDFSQRCRTESPRNKNNAHPRDSPLKFLSYPSPSPHSLINPETPSKNRKTKGRLGKDDVCFGTDVNMEKDFDFETNLALFDKKAVMGEIQSGRTQGPVNFGCKPVLNFRHDENVLESLPPTYRQIHLPCPSSKEFLTDSGLIVPSASPSLRGSLSETMNNLGISVERRSESIARAVAEVSLHLLGGPHRLTPKNSHQKPVVVAFCGSHPEAAGVVCAARHLATLGVTTIVYLQGLTVPSFMVKEIELYKLTGQSIINDKTKLPKNAVDLILACLIPPTFSGGEIPKMNGIIEWANGKRAPIMAIDQPPSSVFSKLPWLQIKCSLSADLPLAYGEGDGKLYLYSLSTPRKVFQTMGIDYDSPFGSKFVITLNES